MVILNIDLVHVFGKLQNIQAVFQVVLHLDVFNILMDIILHYSLQRPKIMPHMCNQAHVKIISICTKIKEMIKLRGQTSYDIPSNRLKMTDVRQQKKLT